VRSFSNIHTSGRVHPAVLLLLVAVAGIAASAIWMKRSDSSAKPSGSAQRALLVHCAASLKAPVEMIAKDYEAKHGVTVRLQFGATQTLLSSIEVSKTGDLFLPADDSYFAAATAKQLVSTTIPMASQTAVLAVAKGNPKGVKSLADLQRADVRVALANPEAAAVGKLTRAALGVPAWEALAKKAALMAATITEAANSIKAGAADAAFVFDSTLAQYPEFEQVTVPELATATAHVGVGLLTCAKDSAEAMRFARFLAASDAGLPVMKKSGFNVVEGDPWAETPELTVYAGSMLRPAIDQTISDFEKREGCHIARVYNGCGILVGQMKAGSKPDAYFACDNEFMNQVQDSFLPRDEISQNELVILVPKGNPRTIADLRDLTKENLRVGIGHEKQCAMGWLTQRTLSESGITDQFMKNVKVQVPAGDMLVNMMLAGSLDAAVVYLSNAVGSGDKLDAVRIQGIKCSVATQPFAIAKGSPHKQLMSRLHEVLRSAASQEKFKTEGFQWK
jgi:molybdenum ABC transporter molybdate-binding protein